MGEFPRGREDRNLRLGLGLGFGLSALLIVSSYLAYRFIRLRSKMSPDKCNASAESENRMESYHISGELQFVLDPLLDRPVAASLALPDMADGHGGGGSDVRANLGPFSPAQASDCVSNCC